MARSDASSMQVKTKMHLGGEGESDNGLIVEVSEDGDVLNTVCISTKPSCTCTYFTKADAKGDFQVCQHMYFVYIFFIGARINDHMSIHQSVMTKEMLDYLLTNVMPSGA
jgi:hypothetical protein